MRRVMVEIEYVLILLTMIFFHIIDDYYLQGILASLKQKEWWEKNAPDELYKNDYKMALFMHSFSWSFMIMLPLITYAYIIGLKLKIGLVFWYIINLITHAFVDDLKANKGKINLIQDQIIHLIQIAATWGVFALNII